MKIEKLLWLGSITTLACKKEGNMAWYAVDVRDGVVQRVTEESSEVDKQGRVLIEAGSAKQALAKSRGSSAANGSTECNCCHHSHCSVCEEYSVTKQYSDYWICHHCGELNRRVPNLSLREVSHGLG
jgi:hypothetical protein